MLIRIQSDERYWSVQYPQRMESVRFHNGATAFDFADALAREHHERTGEPIAVRVEVGDAHVDTSRYGA